MFDSKRAIAEYYGRDGHDVMVLLTLRGYENAIKVLGTQGKSYFTFVDKLAVSGKPVRKAWIITY